MVVAHVLARPHAFDLALAPEPETRRGRVRGCSLVAADLRTRRADIIDHHAGKAGGVGLGRDECRINDILRHDRPHPLPERIGTHLLRAYADAAPTALAPELVGAFVGTGPPHVQGL